MEYVISNARTVTPNKYKTALRVSKVKSSLTLKSLTTTGWEYRWAAVKAVHEQLDSIKDMLLLLSNDKTPRVYHHSRSLFTAVCDLEFIFELHYLKVILLSTDALSLYPQGKYIDVVVAQKQLIQQMLFSKDVEMKILLIQFEKNIKKWVLLFLKWEKTLASKLKIRFHNDLNHQKRSKHFLVNMQSPTPKSYYKM